MFDLTEQLEVTPTNINDRVDQPLDQPLPLISAPTPLVDDSFSLMEHLLNQSSNLLRRLQSGQVVEGTVMYKDRDELLVDIGTKSEGVVSSRELQSLSPEELQSLAIGETVLVYVVQPENQEGQAVLSIDRARREKSWLKLQNQCKAGEIIEAEVLDFNKGGLLVRVDGINGFVPISQISRLMTVPEANRQAEVAQLVNSTLALKVIEVDRDRNRLILSERQASQEQREVKRARLFTELEAGQVRDGIVTNLTRFGAFVDLGGADGLIYMNELSWNKVNDPAQMLQVGQAVKVHVLKIEDDGKRISLSLKRLQPEPWLLLAETLQAGQLLPAIITQVTGFGAFARISEGIEGLIHISELSETPVEQPGEVVKVGDEVTVRVLNIDQTRRRIALSLKPAGASEVE